MAVYEVENYDVRVSDRCHDEWVVRADDELRLRKRCKEPWEH